MGQLKGKYLIVILSISLYISFLSDGAYCCKHAIGSNGAIQLESGDFL